MKLSVAVGSQMSKEAWQAVSRKLLYLVGGYMIGSEQRAVQEFIMLAGRAWPDLEQRAKDENPGASAPPAPVDR